MSPKVDRMPSKELRASSNSHFGTKYRIFGPIYDLVAATKFLRWHTLRVTVRKGNSIPCAKPEVGTYLGTMF